MTHLPSCVCVEKSKFWIYYRVEDGRFLIVEASVLDADAGGAGTEGTKGECVRSRNS